MSARYTGGLVYNAPGGWSGYFDGTGDYLSTAANTAFAFGTGDFTIEFWSYKTANTPGSYDVVFGTGDVGTGNNGYFIELSSTRGFVFASGNAVVLSYSMNPNTSSWSHYAVTRSGTTLRLFVNGYIVASTTYSTSLTSTVLVRVGGSGNEYFGYLSSVRVVKGTAVYTANFTPPTGALQPISGTSLLTCAYPTFVDGSTNNFTITVNGNTAVSTVNPFPTSQLPNPALGGAGNGVYTMSQYAALKAANLWPAYDPYYKNVTLNLHGNAGAVLPFNTDASTNNFQVTQVGNTSPSNYTPFITNGYWSNYFNGSSYLQVAYNSALDASTGPFTYEAWLNPSTTTNKQYLGGSVTNAFFAFVGSGTIFVGRNNVAVDFTSSTGINTNQWNHVVIVRNSSNNIAIFINGVSAYYNASNTNNYGLASNPLRIGVATTGSSYEYNGYISNVRIAKSALYDPTASTITVPTAPLTAGSAGLLTCQSNRFVDNSSNAFALTTSGSPAVNPLQPFTAPTGTSAYGSGYFDGTGDWLTCVPDPLQSGTNSFTIEAWVYPTASRYNPIITRNWTGNNKLILAIDSTGAIVVWVGHAATGWYTGTSGTTPCSALNAWYHVALVRNGSTVTAYVNGVSVLTGSTTATMTDSNTTPMYIGYYLGDGSTFQGYISNLRVVNGTAVYTSAFTPPTSPLTAITNTSLLTVQTNAPSQNNTFLDSSTNNFVITRNGNTTQGTFTPYGSNWSNYFNGSSGVTVSSTSSQFGFTGDFTWEAWVNLASLPSSGNSVSIIGSRGTVASNSAFQFFLNNNSGTYRVGSTISVSSTDYNPIWDIPSVPSLGVWYHVAVVRSGSSVQAYWNGTAIGSAQTASGTTNTPTVNPTIGFRGGSYNDLFLSGYISNLRMVGSAVYTSNFTPNTTPLTAISGTRILTCQSNRFIDNSANAFSLTAYSSPSVQRFSPFSPTTAYSTSVIGGSGYFDGSGDSLGLSTQAAVPTGTQEFTFEFWVYKTGAWSSANKYIVNDTGSGGFQIWVNTGAGVVRLGRYGIAPVLDYSYSSLPTNAWVHFAYSRKGNNFALWVNGTRVATATDSNGFASSNGVQTIGGDGTSDTWDGYLANIRVVKGSYVYDTASTTITVPTAPLSAVSGTSLLLNFTNAGILDNAMMNDLETVGNAQISTSVKKYGTGSMYFDGTGDYLKATNTLISNFGSGAFTVEAWVYFNSVSGTQVIAGNYQSSTVGWSLGKSGSTGYFYASFSGDGNDINGTTTVAINTWYHVAISGTPGATGLKLFVNGVQEGSTYTGAVSLDATTPLYISDLSGLGYGINGYIDDLRITKGVARYTTTFTPPTSQLQDQ